MKKGVLFFCLLCIFFSSRIFSQGLYFDLGVGLGSAQTKFDGTEFKEHFNPKIDIAGELGLKVGYGPFAAVPFFFVADINVLGHRLQAPDFNSYSPYPTTDVKDYFQFNSYHIGPGIIVYPISFLQLSGSAGYSFVDNETNYNLTMKKSKSGFAWNIAAALDLGKGKAGTLLGVKFSQAINELESDTKQDTTMISGFLRLAFRSKSRKQ